MEDFLINENGEKVKLDAPSGFELPPKGFDVEDKGYQSPLNDSSNVKIVIDKNSDRLQLLDAFGKWNGNDIKGLKLLIKVKGKCTTDHISMAGPWLRFRGHLENISMNLLIGATNSYNNKINCVKNQLSGKYEETPVVAKNYVKKNIPSIIVGEENYGEGSSREHAAMEPRFLGVKVVLVKSFARIHETNLKKQGILALTFVNKNDYKKILEDDIINIIDLKSFNPNKDLLLELIHYNGSTDSIKVSHSYNKNQIEWFKAGSALNLISSSEE